MESYDTDTLKSVALVLINKGVSIEEIRAYINDKKLSVDYKPEPSITENTIGYSKREDVWKLAYFNK